MDKKTNNVNMPIVGMLILGILGAVIVSASCAVISHWPLPVSVVPYFGGAQGFWWGAVVGAITGLIIGYLVDEKHFTDTTY